MTRAPLRLTAVAAVVYICTSFGAWAILYHHASTMVGHGFASRLSGYSCNINSKSRSNTRQGRHTYMMGRTLSTDLTPTLTVYGIAIG